MFNEDKLVKSLAIANNERNQDVWNFLRECLKQELRGNLPYLLLPYNDVTDKEILELIETPTEYRISGLKKTSIWGRLWQK